MVVPRPEDPEKHRCTRTLDAPTDSGARCLVVTVMITGPRRDDEAVPTERGDGVADHVEVLGHRAVGHSQARHALRAHPELGQRTDLFASPS